MLPFIFLFAIGALYRWLGRSPRRERIATWPWWKGLGYPVVAVVAAILLDPDHGIVRRGPHMIVVAPLVVALLFGGPTLLARWISVRATWKGEPESAT